jgi:hypothetical protein
MLADGINPATEFMMHHGQAARLTVGDSDHGKAGLKAGSRTSASTMAPSPSVSETDGGAPPIVAEVMGAGRPRTRMAS